MNKIIIDKKLARLEDELKYIANIHNLHIIEVINIFNFSLIKAYKKEPNETLVAINNKYQIVIYDIKTKGKKLYNISKEKFISIYGIFNKEVTKKGYENLTNSFHDTLRKRTYLELIPYKRSRKYLMLKPVKKEGLNKFLHFKYKIQNIHDDKFIDANKSFWIYTDHRVLNEINKLKNKHEDIEINCSIIDKRIVQRLAEHFFERIADKTNGNIQISLNFVNQTNRLINVSCNKYIPVLFIKYIQSYVYENTSYTVSFDKKDV